MSKVVNNELKIEGSTFYVSGGRGFIGSRFLEMARYKNAKVLELSRSEFEGKTLSISKTDFIVHLAGQKSSKLAFKEPAETLDAEFKMALSLLEAARVMKQPPRKILLISSVGVYDGEGLVSESDANFVNSIYTASKTNIENLGLSYALEYNLPVTIARLSNVYGPGQTVDALIPSIIIQMAKNISEHGNITLGNIQAIRDFIFVDDVVQGLLHLLLSSNSTGKVFNVSTGIGHSVKEIVSLLSEILNYNGSIDVNPSKVRINERKVLVANNQRLKLSTGWKTKFSLKDGLIKTASHYMKNIKLCGEGNVL